MVDFEAIARAAGWHVVPDFANYSETPGELSIRHRDLSHNDSSFEPNADGWRLCCEEAGLIEREAANEAEREAGASAERAGVMWWNNPHPSGSVAAYEWDRGHTAARRIREAHK